VTDRDEETPVVKITDKRRFANVTEGPADEAGPSHGGEGEPSGSAESPGDVAAARAEAQEYLGHLQRLQAEFDNYRKRVLREQTSAVERAAEPVMRRLLEVLDDFELAILSSKGMAGEDQPDLKRFDKGVELVYAKLVDALKAEGLERIHAEGQAFDPELHEALMQTGDGDGDPVVAEVFRPGYTLKGRVIRPAGVRVERV
jgi:molecular chaperone GrpE